MTRRKGGRAFRVERAPDEWNRSAWVSPDTGLEARSVCPEAWMTGLRLP